MQPDLPPDPFADVGLNLRILLWGVQEYDEETGEVIIKMTAEGWGWLHTICDEVDSDGTYGHLSIRTLEEEV